MQIFDTRVLLISFGVCASKKRRPVQAYPLVHSRAAILFWLTNKSCQTIDSQSALCFNLGMKNANEINEHLKNGGVVQVTTYTRSTLYNSKHAGWFEDRDGSLYVRSGRRFDQLSIGERMLVGIRFGRVQEVA